jgi:hypothetical protein
MSAMFRDPSRRTVFFIWLGWVIIMLVYQALVPARLNLERPDLALSWTPGSTQAGSQEDKKYLADPFLNAHVSWDSEYYLAIANGGYEDPAIQRVNVGGDLLSGGSYWPFVIPTSSGVPRAGIPLSYAFFPLYPLATRLVAAPLTLLGLSDVATVTLAGVMVSMLGTLAAMLALYELARQELDAASGVRAAFYLLIFPSGFFLAQVYTEGLFVGLAFSSLVLLRRGQRGWAALLAVLATFTRAVGVVLVIPLFISWLEQGEWLDMDLEWRQIYDKGLPWRAMWHGLVALSPVIFFLLWRVSYLGMAFGTVEEHYFGRGMLSLGPTFISWSEAFQALFGSNPQAAAYYAVEFGAIFLALAACIYSLRRCPDLAWFGFLVVFLSWTSGPAQGMHRYVLAAPPLFIFLSRLGRNPAFDRVWTVLSVLLMGLMATMFTFDMWAG